MIEWIGLALREPWATQFFQQLSEIIKQIMWKEHGEGVEKNREAESAVGQTKNCCQDAAPHICNTYQLFKHVNFQTKNTKNEMHT